jgi:hypothetical protein
MQYLGFAVGAMAIILVARSLYGYFERLNRSRKFRGARACLDAVHDTLADLEKCTEGARDRRAMGSPQSHSAAKPRPQ